MQLSQLQTIADNFYKELKDAQAGKKTSLPFIRHQLSLTPKVKRARCFRYSDRRVDLPKCAGQRINGKIAIERSVQQPLPVFKTEDMFSLLHRPGTGYIRGPIWRSTLPTPMTPLARDGYLDGTLVSGSKEHAFDGLVGHAVGDSIERYIKDKQNARFMPRWPTTPCVYSCPGLRNFQEIIWWPASSAPDSTSPYFWTNGRWSILNLQILTSFPKSERAN